MDVSYLNPNLSMQYSTPTIKGSITYSTNPVSSCVFLELRMERVLFYKITQFLKIAVISDLFNREMSIGESGQGKNNTNIVESTFRHVLK